MTEALRNTTFVFQPVALSRDQAYALLTEDMAGVLFPPPGLPEGTGVGGITTSSAAPKHTGAMVALVPSHEDLERLCLEDGEPMEELHLTLAYLGEADQIDPAVRQSIMATCVQYFGQPVSTEAFSVNFFNPHTEERPTAIVLGIKGEDLIGPRGNVMSAVRGAYGGMPEQHEPWIPHVTLKYTDNVIKERRKPYLERLGPVTFDTLRFAFGGEVTDIPLYAPNTEEALTAAKWLESKHPRNSEGKFTGVGTPDLSSFASRIEAAKSGRAARNTARSVKDAGNKEQFGVAVSYEADSRRINDALRTGGFDASKVARERDALDSMMAGSPLGDDIEVIRGIANPSSIFGSAWKPDGDNAGIRWRDPAFVSTTTSDKTSKLFAEGRPGDQPTIMRMLVPKGTSALKMDTGWASQKEVLLDRNLVFQIVRDNGTDKNGVRNIDVEVVPAPEGS